MEDGELNPGKYMLLLLLVLLGVAGHCCFGDVEEGGEKADDIEGLPRVMT